MSVNEKIFHLIILFMRYTLYETSSLDPNETVKDIYFMNTLLKMVNAVIMLQ